MIDIAAAREGFRDKVISDIELVRINDNIADGLTKKISRSIIQQMMNSSRLDYECVQWIIRDEE